MLVLGKDRRAELHTRVMGGSTVVEMLGVCEQARETE